MKTMFIEAKSKEDITSVIKKFKEEGKVGLVSSIQFLDQLPKAQKLIKNSVVVGQVLGCNMSNPLKHNVDLFLYVGSAFFYPVYLAYKTNKPVYIANPLTNKISKVEDEEINKYKKKIQGKQAKFLMSNRKGIIVSSKPGQERLKQALELNYPIFICNNLDLNELENFSEIDYWINTACNRIEGKNIINLEDLPKSNER